MAILSVFIIYLIVIENDDSCFRTRNQELESGELAFRPRRLKISCYGSIGMKIEIRNAETWIRKLALKKHPEGGYYREAYRASELIPHRALPPRYTGKRAFATSIYFLLRGNEVSRFHRLKSDETWYFHLGSPITIHVIDSHGRYSSRQLGRDHFQYTISAGSWFGAVVDEPNGFTLTGCAVSPGFDFKDFEMGRRANLITQCPAKKVIIERLTAGDRQKRS
jgi:predicted cupin superfamily sugar epimerase